MPEPIKPAKKPLTPAPKGPGSKLDLATLAGIVIALAGIIGGLLLENGSIQDVAQATAAMIVLGGTFGAVLVTTPLPGVIRAFKALKRVVFEQTGSSQFIIDDLIQYAAQARKSGIITLETVAAAIADPFLRKALNLAVDGTDLQELKKMMEIDLAMEEQAAEADAKVWESAGGYAPTVGIIGAVMGLIQVMKHLEDIKEVGHGIAVAFVATLYGVASANLLFLPCAAKLHARSRQATLVKEMMLEGVAGIAQGLNPTMIRMKLESFNQLTEKPKLAAAAKPAKAGEMKAASASS
jgi:chemotaxis protein MotA